MDSKRIPVGILATLMAAVLPVVVAGANDAASVADQVGALQTMCAESEEARTQRQAHSPLYERLGGYDRIHDLTREIVRLHKQNESIQHMFTHVDSDNLARHVADFVASGTGGSQSYTGRTMPAAHAHLEITDADFLSAGGDIVKAMQTKGYGQEEIDEIICILVSFKDQVVLK